MIAVHISINDGEYVERIRISGVSNYQISKTLKAIRLNDLYIEFDNEIIALTDHICTLWVNPGWITSPYINAELLPHYPAHPKGINSATD